MSNTPDSANAAVAALPPAPCSASAPRFHRWRIRKALPNGFFTACTYNGRVPMTSDEVLSSPSVVDWLKGGRLDEIYHPEE